MVHGGDRPDAVSPVEITDGKITDGKITDGKITGVYAVRDPDKLAGVAVARRISR
ncbi:hypothetical protein GCM10010300_82020 [Streptomyces olivaceoviridis]|uniref:RNA polymerase subunit sigma n=1 Tax=Streptomyces olivaceoviridis TaxID=1921 RepID=UPI00198BD65B|nr:RNA polymerase subunit sigma [Streptomyces olivaceoviridis]GGZ26220.1 hypothetical protein GCM10010300_82020 [Streptomyces olivaceoviridis]